MVHHLLAKEAAILPARRLTSDGRAMEMPFSNAFLQPLEYCKPDTLTHDGITFCCFLRALRASFFLSKPV